MNDQLKPGALPEFVDSESTDIGFAECTDIRFSRGRHVQLPGAEGEALGRDVTRNFAPTPSGSAPPRPGSNGGEKD